MNELTDEDGEDEKEGSKPNPTAPSAAQQIYLRVGERYPLENAGGAKIVPQSVASLHRAEEGALIIAHSAGNARLFDSDERAIAEILVKGSKKVSGRPNSVAALAQQIPGLKISDIAGKPTIQGYVYGRMQYQKLLLFLAQKSNVLVLATAPSAVKQSLVLQAQQDLEKQGLDNAKVGFAGNRFFLEGFVSTPAQLDRAYELASRVIPNIENHIAVPLRADPTITVRVFILELSRNAHQTLGLQWPGIINGAAVISPKNLVFGPSWAVQLQHLQQNGEAKVLAEPMLAVKSGSQAELIAGGQIPIHITGKFENKVVWKNYGLRLKIHVAGMSSSLAGDHIRTRIETSASQLDEATAVDGVPGIKNNVLKTEVDAKENQPILLTGLFHAGQAKNVEKLPILGDIPLFGELFKSRRFQEHESELLVALLPKFGATEASLPLSSARGLDFDFKWRPLD